MTFADFITRVVLAAVLMGACWLALEVICVAFINDRKERREEQRLAREAGAYLRKIWSEK